MFRLNDPALCQHVCATILAPYFAHTEETRLLLPDGTYAKVSRIRPASQSRSGSRFNVQEFMVGVAESADEPRKRPHLSRFLEQQTSPVFELLSTKWSET